MPAARRKNGTDGLAVVDAPLDQLHPHPRNPRKITAARLEQLQRTLEAERDMLRARPVIALLDGTVVAGNQRLVAARALGWESIPTVFADLDAQQQTRWMLLDNRPFGEDVDEDVAALLAELDAAGSDLLLTGYDSADIDRILASVDRAAVDPDAAPPVPTEPRSVVGEVYDLGPHRLICGDATEGATVSTLLGDERVAIVWTDPPYGVEVVGRTASKLQIRNDNLGAVAFRDFLAAAFTHAVAACRPGATWYVAAPMGPQMAAFTGPLLDLGIWRQTLIWVKDVFVLSRADYHYKHEAVLYGAVAGAESIAPPELAYAEEGSEALIYGWEPSAAHLRPPTRKQDTVWVIPRPKASVDHPTMKPVALIERALANSSARGDLVLDPFAGAGSTLIAAERLGRSARLVEIDPVYCDVIRQRYADYTNRPDLAP